MILGGVTRSGTSSQASLPFSAAGFVNGVDRCGSAAVPSIAAVCALSGAITGNLAILNSLMFLSSVFDAGEHTRECVSLASNCVRRGSVIGKCFFFAGSSKHRQHDKYLDSISL